MKRAVAAAMLGLLTLVPCAEAQVIGGGAGCGRYVAVMTTGG